MPITRHNRLAVAIAILSSVIFSAAPVTARGTGPQAPVSQELTAPRPDQNSIRVTLDTNGQIRINGEAVERANLKSRLEDLLKSRADKTAFVIAAPATPFSAVVSVIDIVRDSGVTKVGLLAEVPAR